MEAVFVATISPYFGLYTQVINITISYRPSFCDRSWCFICILWWKKPPRRIDPKVPHHPPPTPDQLRSIQHVCKCKECYHPPHPPQTSCVASNMCASASNVIIPPHPPQTSCVASYMCASASNVIIPPHPPQTSCVASNMCASARNVIIPPHPSQTSCVASNMCASARNLIIPPPHQLRSIQHVCKCKECYHPPHPPQTSCVASNMCASARNVIIPPHPPQTSCVASNMCASARNVIIPPPWRVALTFYTTVGIANASFSTHAESGQVTNTPLSLDTAKHSRYILSTMLYTQK